jgi:pSer/pThr/pTyr-binding forkhead associated (FHA) protein
MGKQMPKLILTLDDALLGEFPLDKKCVTIGRRPTNDIHIDNLAVSGEHARVITVGEESVLEDLESTNGSLVNGAAVTRQQLHHGDVIGVGRYHLRYVNESAIGNAHAVGQPVDFENTILVQSPGSAASAPAQPHDVAMQEGGGEESPVAACVQVLNGPGAGRELPLNKTLTTLGKSGVQVAVITRRPHGYFITHVEGKANPTVNGVSIGVQAHQLNDHDIIELAGVKMEFFLTAT